MKTKLFTLLLAVAASIETMFAWDYERVQIGNLYYNLDATNQTAEVTSQYSSSPYWSTTITTAIIPASVEYNSVTYSVTSIGEYAFYLCTGLTSVEIPNSVTNIGNSAFANCSGLTSVTIPNSVTSIGRNAFYGCSGLEKVNITDIAAWCNITFGNYRSNPLSYAKHLYVNDVEVTDLVIPNSVTSIGEWAFSGCSSLTSIEIPNSVTSIGEEAFANCSGLTSVTIPNSVTSIGNGAFYGCSGLTSIEIPTSVTSIGNSAFYGCSSLTSVTIPNSVTSIGNYAFYMVNNIVYSGSATGSPWGAKCVNGYVEGWLVYSDNTKTTLLGCSYAATGDIIILNSVTSIGAEAFAYCTGLNSVTIPTSVTSIGAGAFYGCTGLTSVTIEADTPPTIGFYCFYSYVDYYNNDFPLNISIYVPCGTLDTYKTAEVWSDYASLIKYVPLPYKVSTIAENGNVTTSDITTLTICEPFITCTATPNYGYHFVEWSDGNTDNPRTIELTQDTTFTAEFTADMNGQCGDNLLWSFSDSILTITGTGDMWNQQPWVVSKESIKQVVFPQGITSIGSNAFYGCSGLTSIEIPNSVTSIGRNAFLNCTGLTSVVWNAINCNSYNFGSQVTSFTFGDEVEVIPASLCYGMNQLTEIVIPNSVTSIGENAFSGCTGLTFVDAPTSVFEAGESSWPNYTHILQNVTFNSGELTYNVLGILARSYKTLTSLDISGVTNTSLADEAFKGYYNITSLVLPEGLEYMGYMSVADCKNLQSIDIPASVVEISQSAFENCRSLTTINFGGSTNSAPGRFSAPASSASLLQRIGNWAFYNCHELQHLEIPEGVTEIGDGAFYGCVYLEELSLPASVQSIGDNTFALCAKMKKIVVNATTPPSIQAKTFYDVKRQIPVYVPDDVVAQYENDPYWQEFDIQGVSQMPTAIEEVSSSLQTGDRGRLILHNGQILILRGDHIYTLTGQEVQ